MAFKGFAFSVVCLHAGLASVKYMDVELRACIGSVESSIVASITRLCCSDFDTVKNILTERPLLHRKQVHRWSMRYYWQ